MLWALVLVLSSVAFGQVSNTEVSAVAKALGV